LRQIALTIVAVALFAAGPAAAWETYSNEPLGYSVAFPSKPKEGTGVYHSDLAPNAPTHFVSLKDGDSSFVTMVIDTGRPEDGAILMGEVEYWLGHIGEIAQSNVSRLNVGMEYGRFLTVDCRDDFVVEDPAQGARGRQMIKDAGGIVCPNGARLTANMFFTRGRLYIAIGVQAGPDAKVSGTPVRFVNSLAWIGENEKRARANVDWAAVNAVRGKAPPAPEGGQ